MGSRGIPPPHRISDRKARAPAQGGPSCAPSSKGRLGLGLPHAVAVSGILLGLSFGLHAPDAAPPEVPAAPVVDTLRVDRSSAYVPAEIPLAFGFQPQSKELRLYQDPDTLWLPFRVPAHSQLQVWARTGGGPLTPTRVMDFETRSYIGLPPGADTDTTELRVLQGFSNIPSVEHRVRVVRDADSTFATAVVWDGENEWDAKSKTETVPLPGISPRATTLRNALTGIEVASGLGHAFVSGVGPENHSNVARAKHNDSFAQGSAYVATDRVRRAMNDAWGSAFWVSLREAIPNARVFRGVVNTTNEHTAYFEPGEARPMFGTLYADFGKPHTGYGMVPDEPSQAESAATVTHEEGHRLSYLLAPNLWGSRNGGPILEALADILEAIMGREPCMESSEPDRCLRNVENTKRLRDVEGGDDHERGEVYAGLFWSLSKALHEARSGEAWTSGEDLNASAARTLLRLWVYTHVYVRPSKTPAQDFVWALNDALSAMTADGSIQENECETLRSILGAQAAARDMLTPGPDGQYARWPLKRRITRPELHRTTVKASNIQAAAHQVFGKRVSVRRHFPLGSTNYYMVRRAGRAASVVEQDGEYTFIKSAFSR